MEEEEGFGTSGPWNLEGDLIGEGRGKEKGTKVGK